MLWLWSIFYDDNGYVIWGYLGVPHGTKNQTLSGHFLMISLWHDIGRNCFGFELQECTRVQIGGPLSVGFDG
jgi:hypothetical protein